MVVTTGRPFRTDRYLEDTRFGPDFLTVARIEDLHAYMAVPITIEDRVEGFLSVANRDDRRLTDRALGDAPHPPTEQVQRDPGRGGEPSGDGHGGGDGEQAPVTEQLREGGCDRRTKGAATGAPIDQRRGAVFVIGVQPCH